MANLTSFPKLSAQVGKDFVISNSGSRPSISSDVKGHAYVSWANLGDAIHEVNIDSLGTVIDSMGFVGTSASLSPRMAITQRYLATVWEDRIANNLTFFVTYIKGNIRQLNSSDSGIYLMFNDDVPADWIRGSPDVGFLSDTTIVVAWSGNGSYTPSPRFGIYAQIASVSGLKAGNNFLVTDHIGSSIDNANPRIVSRKGNNFFFVIWRDNSTGQYDFYGRKFDLDGIPQGSSFLISDDTTITNLFYYAVSQDTSGNFVIAWIADKGEKSQMEWRWYDKNGLALTPVRQLTPLDTLFGAGNSIDVSIDEKNRIVMVWEQNTTVNSESKIYGQRYLPGEKQLGTSFKVSLEANDSSYEIYPTVVSRGGKIFTVWQTDTGGVEESILYFDSIATSIHGIGNIPNSAKPFSLYQNYPNPFNPSTTIKFNLKLRENVSLGIFDILGREVSLLLDRTLEPGTYTLNWNGKNSHGTDLPSGVYLVKLAVENNSHTEKILLLR